MENVVVIIDSEDERDDDVKVEAEIIFVFDGDVEIV